MIKNCLYCKKDFLVKWPHNGNLHLFCSPKCSARSRFISHHVVHVCGYCKKNMPTVKGDKRVFCSKTCAGKSRQLAGTPWPGIRGGNGGFTETQIRLKMLLGCQWKMEHPISTGFKGLKRKKGVSWCYRVDIAYPKLKFAVEVDGASHNKKKNKELDQKKDNVLRGLGWRVFRFTNREIQNNIKQVVEKIKYECCH